MVGNNLTIVADPNVFQVDSDVLMHKARDILTIFRVWFADRRHDNDLLPTLGSSFRVDRNLRLLTKIADLAMLCHQVKPAMDALCMAHDLACMFDKKDAAKRIAGNIVYTCVLFGIPLNIPPRPAEPQDDEEDGEEGEAPALIPGRSVVTKLQLLGFEERWGNSRRTTCGFWKSSGIVLLMDVKPAMDALCMAHDLACMFDKKDAAKRVAGNIVYTCVLFGIPLNIPTRPAEPQDDEEGGEEGEEESPSSDSREECGDKAPAARVRGNVGKLSPDDVWFLEKLGLGPDCHVMQLVSVAFHYLRTAQFPQFLNMRAEILDRIEELRTQGPLTPTCTLALCIIHRLSGEFYASPASQDFRVEPAVRKVDSGRTTIFLSRLAEIALDYNDKVIAPHLHIMQSAAVILAHRCRRLAATRQSMDDDDLCPCSKTSFGKTHIQNVSEYLKKIHSKKDGSRRGLGPCLCCPDDPATAKQQLSEIPESTRLEELKDPARVKLMHWENAVPIIFNVKNVYNPSLEVPDPDSNTNPAPTTYETPAGDEDNTENIESEENTEKMKKLHIRDILEAGKTISTLMLDSERCDLCYQPDMAEARVRLLLVQAQVCFIEWADKSLASRCLHYAQCGASRDSDSLVLEASVNKALAEGQLGHLKVTTGQYRRSEGQALAYRVDAVLTRLREDEAELSDLAVRAQGLQGSGDSHILRLTTVLEQSQSHHRATLAELSPSNQFFKDGCLQRPEDAINDQIIQHFQFLMASWKETLARYNLVFSDDDMLGLAKDFDGVAMTPGAFRQYKPPMQEVLKGAVKWVSAAKRYYSKGRFEPIKPIMEYCLDPEFFKLQEELGLSKEEGITQDDSGGPRILDFLFENGNTAHGSKLFSMSGLSQLGPISSEKSSSSDNSETSAQLFDSVFARLGVEDQNAKLSELLSERSKAGGEADSTESPQQYFQQILEKMKRETKSVAKVGDDDSSENCSDSPCVNRDKDRSESDKAKSTSARNRKRNESSGAAKKAVVKTDEKSKGRAGRLARGRARQPVVDEDKENSGGVSNIAPENVKSRDTTTRPRRLRTKNKASPECARHGEGRETESNGTPGFDILNSAVLDRLAPSPDLRSSPVSSHNHRDRQSFSSPASVEMSELDTGLSPGDSHASFSYPLHFQLEQNSSFIEDCGLDVKPGSSIRCLSPVEIPRGRPQRAKRSTAKLSTSRAGQEDPSQKTPSPATKKRTDRDEEEKENVVQCTPEREIGKSPFPLVTPKTRPKSKLSLKKASDQQAQPTAGAKRKALKSRDEMEETVTIKRKVGRRPRRGVTACNTSAVADKVSDTGGGDIVKSPSKRQSEEHIEALGVTSDKSPRKNSSRQSVTDHTVTVEDLGDSNDDNDETGLPHLQPKTTPGNTELHDRLRNPWNEEEGFDHGLKKELDEIEGDSLTVEPDGHGAKYGPIGRPSKSATTGSKEAESSNRSRDASSVLDRTVLADSSPRAQFVSTALTVLKSRFPTLNKFRPDRFHQIQPLLAVKRLTDHFPPAFVYGQVCRAMAMLVWEWTLVNGSNFNLCHRDIAAHLTASMHVTFRHMVTRNLRTKLRKTQQKATKPEGESKDKDLNSSETHLEVGSDDEWMADDQLVQDRQRMATVLDGIAFRDAEIPDFQRYLRDLPPEYTVVQLSVVDLDPMQPSEGRGQFRSAVELFDTVAVSGDWQSNEDYWCRRFKGNTDVRAVTDFLQVCFLGSHMWLMQGRTLELMESATLRKYLDFSVGVIVSYVAKKFQYTLDPLIIRALIDCMLFASAGEITDLALCMWPPAVARVITTLFAIFQKELATSDPGLWLRSKSDGEATSGQGKCGLSHGPVVLILDKVGVFRGWTSMCQKPPTLSDLKAILMEHSLYVYCGHGWGKQFVGGEDLQMFRSKATAIVMGCYSSKLDFRPRVEGDGAPLYFLLAGCPTVMGNLWLVTDRDIDKLTVAMANEWFSTSDPVSLSHSLARARYACKLVGLNGFAPVIYGLPAVMVTRSATASASSSLEQ
ncbi:hypothetical protein EGW08_017761 [Elysia chlorotica]|uniref:separase n=1 Tax=Elysia chlorotica TaxID=188477 RepID=A0A3S1B8C1_ELYCH|nr:hypothetical protein EGW08_017761 [Elysia chlorotica]